MLKLGLDSSRYSGSRYFIIFVPLVWLLTIVLPLVPLWQNLERQMYDVFSVISAPEISNSPIVLVEIDQPTLSNLELSLPWPRGVYGDLIDKLVDAKAKVIALDVIFEGNSVPPEDQRLAEAIARAGTVILAADIEQSQRQQFNLVQRVNPADIFLQAGGVAALAGVDLDPDNTLRRLPDGENVFWQEVIKAFDPALESANDRQSLNPQWIKYFSPANTFTYVSVYQVLQGLVPDTFFENKIVLVGLNLKTESQPGQMPPDTFQTPLFPQLGPLSGIEVHGILISNALLQRSVSLISPSSTYLLSFLFVVLGVASCRDWMPVKSSLLVGLLLIALLMGGYFLFAYLDLWYQWVSTAFGLLLFYLARGGWANLRDIRQKQFLKQAFERYLSPQLIQQMLENPSAVKLGGERKKITTLFTDLAGFTTLSEQMPIEDVAKFLNDHLDAMASIVLQHGGTIDKFIGDSVMAFWGAPLDESHQELKACECALAMKYQMLESTEKLKKSGLPHTSIRIGISTGIVIVGNMGSSKRFDYTVLGDEVNLASRVEGINKLYGTTILITESVVKGLSTETQGESNKSVRPVLLDYVMVKGKSEAVNIFTLDSITDRKDELASAIKNFRAQNWQPAGQQWKSLAEEKHLQTLAGVYLQRISKFEQASPPNDWLGEIALEKF